MSAFVVHLHTATKLQLHQEHAKRLEAARIALKDIRNYENTINPQRERRHQLEREIGKLRTASKPDTATNKKIETLQAELDALIAPNSELSKAELEAVGLKRRLMADSFNKQFDSLQELGEKLAIIAGYGKTLIKDWDTSANAGKSDYVDGARTAAVRSGVEDALSTWDVRRPRIPAPTVNGGSNLHHAPSFHESHAGELASLHSVEDPAAAHREALDSYYNGPPSPATLYQNQYGSGAQSSQGGAAAGNATPVPIPGAGSGSSPGFSSGASTGAPHTTHGASPLVQQLNTAPVSNLPPPTLSGSSGDSPSMRPSGSNSGTSPAPIEYVSPVGSSLAPAPSLPTVAETGAPITGTGGPAKGVLNSPDDRPAGSISAAQSKQEEARQELNRRFEEYSGHNTSAASGSGTTGDYGTDLEREISMRARKGHETLPAYSVEGSNAAPMDKPSQ